MMSFGTRVSRFPFNRLTCISVSVCLVAVSARSQETAVVAAKTMSEDTTTLAIGAPIRDYAVVVHADTILVAATHNAYFPHGDSLVYCPDDKDGKSPLGYYAFVDNNETVRHHFQDDLGPRAAGRLGDEVFLSEDGRLIHITQHGVSFCRYADDGMLRESVPVEWRREMGVGVTGYYPGLYAGDGVAASADFFVINDWTDEGFEWAIDNMIPHYKKDYLIEIHGTNISEPRMIQQGDAYCTLFHAVRKGDTLYGVWLESKNKSNFISGQRQILLTVLSSRFDGRFWSRPSVVIPPEATSNDQRVHPLGLFESDSTWHVLWVSRGDEASFEVHVSAGDPRETWREISTDIPIIQGLDRERLCHIEADDNGTVHMIAGYPGKEATTQYLVYSKGEWLYGGDVLHGAFLQSLTIDGNTPYLVWTDTPDRSRTINVMCLADRVMKPLSERPCTWQ